MGIWICPIWRATGSLNGLHNWADTCRRTWCGDERQVGLFLASSQIQWLKVDVSQKTKHHLSTNVIQPFVTFCERVCPFWDHIEEWRAHIEHHWLHCRQHFTSVSGWEACGVSRNLAVARMVIWTMRKKGLYHYANFSHHDLKMLGSHNIQQKVDKYSKPDYTKGGNVGVILPSSSCTWHLRSRSFRTPSQVSRLCFPLNP